MAQASMQVKAMKTQDAQNTQAQGDHINPVPRVTIQIFVEDQAFHKSCQEAAQDRRLSRAHIKIMAGGLPAAIETYKNSSTPNLIIVDSSAPQEQINAMLDQLAMVCDPGTKVIVVGRVNDVVFYRDLIRKGIEEYVVLPMQPMDIVRMVSDVYGSADEGPIGKTIAFVGSKGGVGSSTVAHNVASEIAKSLNDETVLVDFDIAFGTVGLDFYQDPPYGIADALSAKERIDQVFLDRVLHKCHDNLHILAAPASLERTIDITESSYEMVVDLIKATTPYVVLDLPHQWSAWMKHALYTADKVVLTTTNDLASLRNTKNILDTLKALRPNDPDPILVLNQTEMPKRPEIKVEEFAKALNITPSAVINFDPMVFGSASNNGQMIAEMEPNSRLAHSFHDLALFITGRSTNTKQQSSSGLSGVIKKLFS